MHHKNHDQLLTWWAAGRRNIAFSVDCLFPCLPTATNLHMNTDSLDTPADIHLVLSESELSQIVNISINISSNISLSSFNISDYFTQHPNQTQAVSPGSHDSHMTRCDVTWYALYIFTNRL